MTVAANVEFVIVIILSCNIKTCVSQPTNSSSVVVVNPANVEAVQDLEYRILRRFRYGNVLYDLVKGCQKCAMNNTLGAAVNRTIARISRPYVKCVAQASYSFTCTIGAASVQAIGKWFVGEYDSSWRMFGRTFATGNFTIDVVGHFRELHGNFTRSLGSYRASNYGHRLGRRFTVWDTTMPCETNESALPGAASYRYRSLRERGSGGDYEMVRLIERLAREAVAEYFCRPIWRAREKDNFIEDMSDEFKQSMSWQNLPPKQITTYYID